MDSAIPPFKSFTDLPRVTPGQNLGGQPHLEVAIHGGSTPGRVYALVDTGAKASCISTGMLKACGITQKLTEHGGAFSVVGGQRLVLEGACHLSLQLGNCCVLKLSHVAVV